MQQILLELLINGLLFIALVLAWGIGGLLIIFFIVSAFYIPVRIAIKNNLKEAEEYVEEQRIYLDEYRFTIQDKKLEDKIKDKEKELKDLDKQIAEKQSEHRQISADLKSVKSKKK